MKAYEDDDSSDNSDASTLRGHSSSQDSDSDSDSQASTYSSIFSLQTSINSSSPASSSPEDYNSKGSTSKVPNLNQIGIGNSVKGFKGAKIKNLVFGNLTRSGVYSVEYDLDLKNGELNYTSKAVCISIMGERITNGYQFSIKILLSLDSVDSLVLDGPYLYFTLSNAPFYYFSEDKTNNAGQKVYYRTTPYNEAHCRVSPFCSKRIRVEFATASAREQFIIKFKPVSSALPSIQRRQIEVDEDLQLYSQEALDKFKNKLGKLFVNHSFQLEAILYDGTLSPLELEEVEDEIEFLVGRRGIKVTENILIELRRILLEERKRVEFKRQISIDGGRELEDSNEMDSEVLEISELLMEAENNVKEMDILERDKNLFDCYHVYISASSILLLGPIIETGNSVLRKYQDHKENFLRVAFVEEDQNKLQINKLGVNRKFLDKFATQTLVAGLKLNGRIYEFLAYSKASLRSHSCWFVSPFMQEMSNATSKVTKKEINAGAIITGMGNFESISFQPTLLGSRISQAFTSSKQSVVIMPEDIVHIEDIISVNRETGKKSIHTDGAGTMSLEMRNKICESLEISTLPLPTVFQVRVAGAKGLIVLDITLQGYKIGLRPSLIKFEGALDFEDRGYYLNVAQEFTKPIPLYLNRPLVSAMDDLKVPREQFLDLQQTMLDEITKNTNSISNIRILLKRYSIGKNLVDVLESLNTISSSDELLKDAYIQLLVDLAREKLRVDIKKAKIFVPSGLALVGVPDLDSWLKEDQIYVCVEVGGERIVKQGKMLITRSPTLDPSDVRVVNAVDIPRGQALRTTALVNCVVLPVTGTRSLCSMMSGGDLDGDLYQLIPLPLLIPKETIPAKDVMGHEGDIPIRQKRRANLGDVAKNVVDFMEKDLVGIVGNEHLRTADRYTGNSLACRELAKIYYRVVDYCKSGVEICSNEIPRKSYAKWPDFLQRKSSVLSDSPIESYYSSRVLGYLWRAVPNATDTPFSFEAPVDHTISLFKTATQKLNQHISIRDLDSSFLKWKSVSQPIARTFKSKLLEFATIYNFPRKPGRNLTEAETFMATILTSPDLTDKKGRFLATTELQSSVEILLKDIKKLVGKKRSLGDQALIYLTIWKLSLEKSSSEFGIASLKWICVENFFDTLTSIERKGWEWKEIANTSPALVPDSTLVTNSIKSVASTSSRMNIKLIPAVKDTVKSTPAVKINPPIPTKATNSTSSTTLPLPTKVHSGWGAPPPKQGSNFSNRVDTPSFPPTYSSSSNFTSKSNQNVPPPPPPPPSQFRPIQPIQPIQPIHSNHSNQLDQSNQSNQMIPIRNVPVATRFPPPPSAPSLNRPNSNFRSRPIPSSSSTSSSSPPVHTAPPQQRPVPSSSSSTSSRPHTFTAPQPRSLPPHQRFDLPEIVSLPAADQPIHKLNDVKEPELVLPKGRSKVEKNRATEREKKRIAEALAKAKAGIIRKESEIAVTSQTAPRGQVFYDTSLNGGSESRFGSSSDSGSEYGSVWNDNATSASSSRSRAPSQRSSFNPNLSSFSENQSQSRYRDSRG